jgi:hypothetical protein
MGKSKHLPPNVNGHRREHVSYGVRVTCLCGWMSLTWYGNGASRSAHAELRHHIAEHAKSLGTTQAKSRADADEPEDREV